MRARPTLPFRAWMRMALSASVMQLRACRRMASAVMPGKVPKEQAEQPTIGWS